MLELGLGIPVIIMVCPVLKDMFCTTTPWKRKKKRTQTTRFQPLPLLELLEIIHPLSFVLHLVLSVQSHSTEPNWTELQTICFHSRDIYELGAAPTRAASRTRTVGWWDNYPSADLLKSSWNDEYQNKQAGNQIFRTGEHVESQEWGFILYMWHRPSPGKFYSVENEQLWTR